jgi:predicted O-methyltransferase YrrM
MSDPQWSQVDEYLNARLIPSDPTLDGIAQRAADAGMPSIAVAANQGKFLMILARAMGARRILEIGTLAGYSTAWLARGLPADGHIVTLEYTEKHADVARTNFEAAGIADQIDLRVGAALETLPILTAEGGEPFDLIFIDADKANIPEYFRWAQRMSRVGTLILVDNVVRDGKILDADSQDADVRGVRRFFDLVHSDPRVTATALQLVGDKGYDGLAIVEVLEPGVEGE